MQVNHDYAKNSMLSNLKYEVGKKLYMTLKFSTDVKTAQTKMEIEYALPSTCLH